MVAAQRIYSFHALTLKEPRPQSRPCAEQRRASSSAYNGDPRRKLRQKRQPAGPAPGQLQGPQPGRHHQRPLRLLRPGRLAREAERLHLGESPHAPLRATPTAPLRDRSNSPSRSQQHAATYAFPDAYIGQNTTLRDTMINLILQSPQTWHTSQSALAESNKCSDAGSCARA